MRSRTALELWEEQSHRHRLSIGCAVLDGCTGGGLPLQGITEVSGEAGAGKTQLALSLALQCGLPATHGGLDGETAYLCCGEGEFPNRRLAQLATSVSGRAGTSSQAELLARVQILQCHNADDVMDALKKKLPSMCASHGVRLVVIDSIAGMVRHEFGSRSAVDMVDRTVLFFKVAKELKWLADIYNVCIVVINQVAGKGFDNNGNGALSSSSSSSSSAGCGGYRTGYGDGDNVSNSDGQGLVGGNDCSPALGLAWSHCINTRICLRRDTANMRSLRGEGGDGGGDGGGGWGDGDGHVYPLDGAGVSRSRRAFLLEFSPYTPRCTCPYSITADGVSGKILSS